MFVSIQENTRQLIRSLPRALESVFLHVQSETDYIAAQNLAQNVEELVITAPAGSHAHQYPRYICIEDSANWFYMLKLTSVDELKYLRMDHHEIDGLKQKLPETWESSWWEDLTLNGNPSLYG